MNINHTHTFSWKTAIFLSLSVGLLVAGLSLFLQVRNATVQASPAAQSKIVPTTTAAKGQGSSFDIPGKPLRLRIPAIGVDAAIQSVGLSWKGNGDMGVPTNFTDVAWYNKGPLPGMPGSAVIDGHVDGKNVPRAVFYNLGTLKQGDVVEVVDQTGRVLKFQVIASKVYDYNAPTTDIFSNDTSKIRLNLITCTGDWIKSQKLYNKRLVVFTELVHTN